jgi:hypothetical protein
MSDGGDSNDPPAGNAAPDPAGWLGSVRSWIGSAVPAPAAGVEASAAQQSGQSMNSDMTAHHEMTPEQVIQMLVQRLYPHCTVACSFKARSDFSIISSITCILLMLTDTAA